MYKIYTSFTGICTIIYFCFISSARASNDTSAKNATDSKSRLVFNPEKIDMLLHTAAVIALMKSKAKALLSGLAQADSVSYAECESNAKNAVGHAKCVVKLLKARDALRSNPATAWLKPRNDGTDIVAQLSHLIVPFVKNSSIAKGEWKTIQSNPIKKSTNWTSSDQYLITMNGIVTTPRVNTDRNFESRTYPAYNFIQLHRTKWSNKRGGQTLKLNSRRKREINNIFSTEKLQEGKLKNIDKLRRLYEFYKMFEHCQQFMKAMGNSNAEFLNESGSPLRYETQNDNAEDVLIQKLQEQLKDFTFEKFPILSPKLFSVFPEEPAEDDKFRPSLLSPNVFSFHDEGVFSLPTIFKLMFREEEVLGWLDLLIEVSGAEKTLDKLDAQIKPKMQELRDRIYPTILRLEDFERRLNVLKNSLNDAQKASFRNYGYTVMHPAQKIFLHSCSDPEKADHSLRYKRKITKTIPNEDALESDIYKIAALLDDISLFSNFSAVNETEKFHNATEININNLRLLENTTEIGLLRPFLYGNKLRQAPALNYVLLSPAAFRNTVLNPRFMTSPILSPSAFTTSTLSPTAMIAVILSPTAFTASILSPTSLFGDVLSPKFFHVNVLTPRTLAALILSPRTMLFNVLSPRFIEFRALSPVTFYIGVLTPGIIVPKVLSPTNFAITVLSPNILSPTILSKGNFTVQILSPSILSGSLNPTKNSTTLAHVRNPTLPRRWQ